jgi:NADPH:quinone reductase
MKAILVHEYGGPDVLRLDEVPDPTAGPGQVVVRIRAAGVNPVDTYIRGGTYARRPPNLPYTPGFDGAGDVEAVGSGVDGWQVGDRVWIAALGAWQGTYAERMVCAPDQIYRLPAAMSYEHGAALGVPATTAHRALFGRAHASRGETVLVHGGSGSVGIPAIQLGKAAGLKMLATAGTDAGKELVTREGADAAFNHHDAGRADAIRSATGGRGVDVVLEMLANVNLDLDLQLLAPAGRVIVIGSRGRIEIDPRLTMAKDGSILGMTIWNVPREELKRVHQDVASALAAGTLRPVIGVRLPLAEAARAHEIVLGSGNHGKVVLLT